MSFATDLDELITKHKATTELGDIIAEMEGAIEGLQAELDDSDD
jgi:hypothetical protein